MPAVHIALALLLGLWSMAGQAASLPLKDRDCAKILERWAEDPDSVPKHLVDACKDQMVGAAAPAAGTVLPLGEPADPCTGPDAANSVLCWGPWGALAPAAAAPVATLTFPDTPGDCELGADISSQCVAVLQPLSAELQLPLDGCAPGTPCGFATLVDGFTSTGDVESTEFKKINLAADGSRYTIDPNGPDEIESVTRSTIITPRNDGYEQLHAEGVDGADEFYLEARVVRDEQSGDIRLAADVWTRANSVDSSINKSGYFAWGVASSQSGLNLLNGNGISMSFAGPMSVNNATTAAMTVNFGSQANWTGTWTNPAWSFGAGGSVSGANMISDAAKFTPNVQSGSFVQGALLGEPGQMGITHIIDVTLTDQGHIKDVGLLREVTAAPVVSVSP